MGGKPCQALLHQVDFFLGGRHLGKLCVQVSVLLLKGVLLALEGFLLLLQAMLLLLQLRAALLELLLVLVARLMNLFLGFQKHFTLLVLAGLDGLVDDASGFLLRAGDLLLRNTLAIEDTGDKGQNHADQESKR